MTRSSAVPVHVPEETDSRAPTPELSPTSVLLSAAKELNFMLDAALDRHRVTLRQTAALRVLQTRPGISYAELARLCHVTKQSMHSTVRHLQMIGAVRRVGTPGSGNTARLYATAHGGELVTLTEQAVNMVDAYVVEALDPRQVETMSAALTALRQLGRDVADTVGA